MTTETLNSQVILIAERVAEPRPLPWSGIGTALSVLLFIVGSLLTYHQLIHLAIEGVSSIQIEYLGQTRAF
jgi:hypothetical protein